MKSRVKSLATPCVTELDRSEVGRENQFYGCNFAKHELAKLLIIYLTTRDRPRSKPHGPRLRSAAHEILKIIESLLL